MKKPTCQSCMMPLNQDLRDGKDGLDPRYCSNCFIAGDFVIKGVTAKEFQQTTRGILRENGWSTAGAWLGTMMIPRLPRWQQDDPDQF